MTVRRLITLGLVLGTCWLQVGASEAEDYPPKCKPYIDTVDRCRRYDTLIGRKGWQTEYRLEIGKRGEVKEATVRAPALPVPQMAQTLRRATDDGQAAIIFDVSQYQQGLLEVGPEVSGEFAIEMRAKAISSRLNDLSIVCDAVGGAPGFQFGGYENTRNILTIGTEKDGSSISMDGDPSVLIQPNTWHRVRLEVRKNEIVGLVDGRVIARSKPAAGYDFEKKRRPLIYLYASSAAIVDYRIDRPAEEVVDVEKPWKDAFVHRTREQVMSDLTELAKLLNDADYVTRQCAHDQLARAGTLAEEPLRAALKTGGLEGRDRARSILRLLGAPVADE